MNAATVQSFLVARQWAMAPRHMIAIAEAIASRLESMSAEEITKAQAAGTQSDRQLYSLRDGVAHIAIAGPIMKEIPCAFGAFGMAATSTLALAAAIDKALDDSGAHAIQLDIESPGGAVEGLQAAADAIYAARGKKPITAHVSDLCASAAYWLACQADSISANGQALVGSIGVYGTIRDASEANKQAGIKVHVLRSHPLKGVGAGDVITDEQLADRQRVIDETAEMFVQAIARGRGLEVATVRELATGQEWYAAAAKDRRLIDEIATAKEAHVKAAGSRVSRSYASASGLPAAANQAAKEKHMELEALKAENEKLKARAEAAEANVKAIELREKVAVLDAFADRFLPAARAAFERLAGTMAVDELKAYMAALPKVTREQPVAVTPEPQVQSPKAEVTEAQKISAKKLASSPERLAKFALIDSRFADGSALMKDGRRLTKDELKAELGI